MNRAMQSILLSVAARALSQDSRIIVAIAGPPAAGKTTLARRLCEELNREAKQELAVCLPMDGFHMFNNVLRDKNLYARKGAPETFRSDLFVQLIKEISEMPRLPHSAPAYDRAMHDPDEHAITIHPHHRVVFVEGNYLLLDIEPWRQAHRFYGFKVFISAGESLIQSRLVSRHSLSGKTFQEIEEKLKGTDIPNMHLINATSAAADMIVDAEELAETEPSEYAPPLSILGLGASTIDMVMLIDRFPTRRQALRALDGRLQGGGPVSTAMAAIGALGGQAGIIDRIGTDVLSNCIRQQYAAFNVSTRYLFIDSKTEPSMATVLVQQHTAERAICFLPGSGAEITSAEIDSVDLGGVRIVHANGRHPTACRQLYSAARKRSIQSSFDGGADRYSKEHHDLAVQSDICIVAKDFADRMTMTTDVETALERIIESGPVIAGITNGIKGSWILRKGGSIVFQPAIRSPATFDTTGCGDSYHGAFLFAYTQDLPLQRCAQIAAAVACINSTALGGRGHLPSLAEVNDLLNEVATS